MQDITLLNATYRDVGAVRLPKASSGLATFTDVTDSTAEAADVAQGKYFYTSSGVKTEGTASGGGGYGYTLLGSTDLTVSTTSTSQTSQGSITVEEAWTKYKLIYVRVRDKAGKRNGYFYGSDTFFINANAGSGSTTSYSTAPRWYFRYNNSALSMGMGTSGYGVYGYDINSSGRVRIYSRYNSTNSLTINGTYKCELYALDWPDGVSPYS